MTNSNGYENAPATKLLATFCACCSRPLVDAVSVETGIGPICRDKLGFEAGIEDGARIEANVLVHRIASKRYGNEVEADAAKLRELGFEDLATKIVERLEKAAKRADKITITVEGDTMILVTPYKRSRAKEMVAALRGVNGRRWDRDLNANTFPTTSKRGVWDFLKEFFPGQLGTGPKGVFEIPKVPKDTNKAVA